MDRASELREHPHRFLEYAPTGRATCKGHCKKKIAQGKLRYGTKVVVQEHEGVSWRCIDCVTERQADNILEDSKKEGKSVHDFLTVPPSDSNGPADEIVNIFVDLLKALHERDTEKADSLRRQLHAYKKKDNDANKEKVKPSKKKRDNHDDGVDVHTLDEQLMEDPTEIDLFVVADLRSLCEHHGLKKDGTKPILKQRLVEYYANKNNNGNSKKKAKK